ncbi:hypothetical protein BU204_11830 [Actinophytocola xanthii]|uniref:Uncharacterized protein n=1 Tax=Actinophytocola xanthii TaxID=1912961 RepID=A0A1Q8CSS2_9PSEU|nr:hypothetical protein BU204_11830 [Actinophytocola xanthii]
MAPAPEDPAPDNRVIAPYITAWTTETEPPSTLVERPGVGIAYTDELLTDRDDKGVLWFRVPSHPRQGRPDFGRVHPMRQRRAMRRLLCQVCAAPADVNDDGVLWLLKDESDQWPSWPEKMAVTEPPVCVRCVDVATRLCPALRQGAVALRVRNYPIAGVRAVVYRNWGKTLMPVEDTVIRYDDPSIRWARAMNLVRQFHDCTVIPLEDLL